jgi:hypothetical protein
MNGGFSLAIATPIHTQRHCKLLSLADDVSQQYSQPYSQLILPPDAAHLACRSSCLRTLSSKEASYPGASQDNWSSLFFPPAQGSDWGRIEAL